jgi:hypothetical protein
MERRRWVSGGLEGKESIAEDKRRRRHQTHGDPCISADFCIDVDLIDNIDIQHTAMVSWIDSATRPRRQPPQGTISCRPTPTLWKQRVSAPTQTTSTV